MINRDEIIAGILERTRPSAEHALPSPRSQSTPMHSIADDRATPRFARWFDSSLIPDARPHFSPASMPHKPEQSELQSDGAALLAAPQSPDAEMPINEPETPNQHHNPVLDSLKTSIDRLTERMDTAEAALSESARQSAAFRVVIDDVSQMKTALTSIENTVAGLRQSLAEHHVGAEDYMVSSPGGLQRPPPATIAFPSAILDHTQSRDHEETATLSHQTPAFSHLSVTREASGSQDCWVDDSFPAESDQLEHPDEIGSNDNDERNQFDLAIPEDEGSPSSVSKTYGSDTQTNEVRDSDPTSFTQSVTGIDASQPIRDKKPTGASKRNTGRLVKISAVLIAILTSGLAYIQIYAPKYPRPPLGHTNHMDSQIAQPPRITNIPAQVPRPIAENGSSPANAPLPSLPAKADAPAGLDRHCSVVDFPVVPGVPIDDAYLTLIAKDKNISVSRLHELNPVIPENPLDPGKATPTIKIETCS